MKHKFWPLVVVLVMLLAAGDALAAKRLGGGSSIGRQRALPAQSRAAPPAEPVPPTAANPVNPALRPAPALGGAAAGLAPRPRSWLGPLAGFAGGALLGGLLFGHGGMGFGGGGFLLPLLLIGVCFFLLRRFMAGMAPPVPPAQLASGGNGMPPIPGEVIPFRPMPAASATPYQPGPAALTDAAPPNIPPGFDVPGFLREARIAFVRLQEANDRGDLVDLRSFTTPEMYATLSYAIQERRGAQQHVEVLALDAHLVDVSELADEILASVRFDGSLREDQGVAEPFSEIWHVRKLRADPQAGWLLAGIQQIT